MMRWLLQLFAFFTALPLWAIDVNVLNYGAKGDRKTLDTKAIQNPIDAVA